MELNLKDTNLSREAALFLSQQILSSNTIICKVVLDLNANVPASVVSDIAKACKRNKDNIKDARLPIAQKELERIRELTGNGEECTFEKRTAFINELQDIQKERKSTMAQVYEQEEMLQELRQQRADIQD